MSWFTSWLPSIPSLDFALPSGLQRRFISFALKQALGHFLQPGQLDVQQVDSQIGSGYVQIRDVELDCGAINALLSGLPIRLHDGSIARVTARIPWPNPLTSSVGLSLESLHLTFHLAPATAAAPHQAYSTLAESVASVADNFINEELTAPEEASLRESLNVDMISSTSGLSGNVPGGLDPFVSDGDNGSGESDPPGISIFATLLESLLSRFHFDASDTKITLVHPDHSSLTLSIPEIRYGEDGAPPPAVTGGSGGSTDDVGSIRTLTVRGLNLSMRCLLPFAAPSTVGSNPSHNASARQSPSSPPSPASVSSDIDDDTQMLMSQSLAMLPPRPASSAGSVEESLYQSAISNTPPRHDIGSTIDEGPGLSSSETSATTALPPEWTTSASPGRCGGDMEDLRDEVILSSGPEPIVIRLITPSVIRLGIPSPPATLAQQGVTSGSERNSRAEGLRVDVTIGTIACSLGSRHLRSLLDISRSLASHTPHPAPIGASPLPQPSIFDNMGVIVDIRAVVVLLVPGVLTLENDRLDTYWSQPLTPPDLPNGSIRVHFDHLHLLRAAVASQAQTKTTTSLSLSDLSIIHFTPAGILGREVSAAMPILITDHNLTTQYPPGHAGRDLNLDSRELEYFIPTFDVMDWTHPSHTHRSSDLSYWRSKLPKSHTMPPMETGSFPSTSATTGERAKPTHLCAARLNITSSSPNALSRPQQTTPMESSVSMECTISPLHFFLSAGAILESQTQSAPNPILWFLSELAPPGDSPQPRSSGTEGGESCDSEEGEEAVSPTAGTLHQHPRNEEVRDTAKHEIRKLSRQKYPQPKQRHKASSPVTVTIPLVRIEVRVPPPPLGAPRSGSLVLDIHDLTLVLGGPTVNRKPSPRFIVKSDIDFNVDDDLERPRRVLLSSTFRRLVVGYSLVNATSATAILSIGSPNRAEDVEQEVSSIVFSQSNPMSKRPKSLASTTQAIMVDIPSAVVHLSKPQIDGLQFWADDLTQLLDRGFSEQPEGEARAHPTSSRGPARAKNEIVIKVSIKETALRMALPRSTGGALAICPFDLGARGTDLLLEMNPDGKDETVITLGLREVRVLDHARSEETMCLLSLTNSNRAAPPNRSLLKLCFTSLVTPGMSAKESRIKLTICGVTYNFYPDIAWTMDLANFFKAPPGAFESVVPAERTHVMVKVLDTSIRAFAPNHAGSVVIFLGESDFETTIEGNSHKSLLDLTVNAMSLYLMDDIRSTPDTTTMEAPPRLAEHDMWKKEGYALVADLSNFSTTFFRDVGLVPPDVRISVDSANINLHLCADTATALAAFIADLTSAFIPQPSEREETQTSERIVLATVEDSVRPNRSLIASLDERAFSRAPEIGPAPDMVYDDLPTNPDYLDESFSAAAGLREFTEDDLNEFGESDAVGDSTGLVSKYGGETIRILHPEGLHIVEHHFDTLPPDTGNGASQSDETTLRIRVRNSTVTLLLYDGYDWVRTRRVIEEERRNMRRKLAKIRQLVASGQVPDPSVDETNTLLFNSVYIGLEHNMDELEPDALIAAIDEELDEDQETASQSSWQSFAARPTSPSPEVVTKQTRHRHKAPQRQRGSSIEFRFMEVSADVDQFRGHPALASRTLVTMRDVEILDHIKTSTWRKFLTSLMTDSKGNIRETDSNMVRVELRKVYPVPGHPTQEARLRAKILPLRLHVDQDALDFLKKFFSFKDPHAMVTEPVDPPQDIFFQQAEVFPVDIKLDYKPRRVDYRALRDGKTIELMNFFHFDGAEMTLRHITLTGISGWARVFDLLNDLWTPDVKATQLVEVISGVSPIRSVVNVGSGVADLVLLPIAQYRKDGRVVRGLQKGTKAFMKSTATEAIKLGARLATGTQVILEQAENVIGGQFKDPIMAETMPPPFSNAHEDPGDHDSDDLISRYADQPTNVKEGVQSAYRSLRRNFNSAAQTILAVPMEVYERSGSEGTARAVVRAVPIAVLKPMIGASEAISKTLLGLHNTIDPSVRLENEAKYKQR